MTSDYVTGTIMMIALVIGSILLSTKRFRKHRYNLFYYAHVTSFLLWAVLSIVHSVYFLPVVLLTALAVYGTRLTMRLLIPVVVMIERINDSFALIELRIRKTRLTRFLLIDRLTRHNGNVDVWLVCHNISYLERHPFSVIETRHRKRHVYVRLLVARLGDWTEKLCDLLTTNEPYDLYSGGVTLSIDHCRTSTDLPDLRRRNRLLFLLRNEEIVVFLRYLVFICDPLNERCRDRVRQIFLHYIVTDLNYLALLREYLAIATAYRCVTITTLVYTKEPVLFNGSPTIDDANDTLKYENVVRTLDNHATTALVVLDSTLRLKIKQFVRRLIDAARENTEKRDALRIL